jgi:hypothetical protein
MLAGRTDPARQVRPVDWSATGARRTDDGDGADGENANGDTEGAAAATARSTSPSDRLPHRRARTVQVPRPAPPPPAGAVHTLQPDDPRPAPRPLHIDRSHVRTVGVDEPAWDTIVLTVADPREAWTSDAGISDHFLRGDLVVQVRRADNTVIGVFAAGYALAVRPDTYQDAVAYAPDSTGRAVRGGRGTRHPTTRRDLLVRLAEAGFEVTPGQTHGRITHPDHPGLFVPLASTPSDVRFTRHAVAQIRRVFGIDLRH